MLDKLVPEVCNCVISHSQLTLDMTPSRQSAAHDSLIKKTLRYDYYMVDNP